MIKQLVALLFVWSPFLSAQQLVCPPDVSKACHDITFDLPDVMDGSGLELITQKEFSGNSCEDRTITVTYILIDAEALEQAQCQYIVTVKPYNEFTLFPRDTILSGVAISEVLNKSVYTDGMFPSGTNECNIFFSFEDILVEQFPNAFVVRNWSAENACDNTTALATQTIRLTNLPHNSIATQVNECGGKEILVDKIEFYYNGLLVQQGECFAPFDSLHQTLNCLADSLLMQDDDMIELRLTDITDPYIGISTIDIIDIQRHILGLKRFEEPCRLSAGDVNRDGRINGLDLVELKRLILGLYTEWPFGDGPELYVNGELRENLSFRKEDFPLTQLEITVVNQGNPSTN